MTETTPPTPEQMREMADRLDPIIKALIHAPISAGDENATFAARLMITGAMLRSAASALDAKGETTGEKRSRWEWLRVHNLIVSAKSRSAELRASAHLTTQDALDMADDLISELATLNGEPAAPPLAPSSEQFTEKQMLRQADFLDHEDRLREMDWKGGTTPFHRAAKMLRFGAEQRALVREACEIMQITYAGDFGVPAGIDSFLVRAHAAPREPQPSSEASAPQMLSVHPSHVMETQRASKMASCVNCDRPLDWPCDANNPREASAPQTEDWREAAVEREPREPHAALVKEIDEVIAEDGFSGGPDKRKSTGKLEAWCPECSSYREEGHDEDCRWLRDHKLLRRCKAAILGSPTEGEQG